jgi:hypothetical protein
MLDILDNSAARARLSPPKAYHPKRNFAPFSTKWMHKDAGWRSIGQGPGRHFPDGRHGTNVGAIAKGGDDDSSTIRVLKIWQDRGEEQVKWLIE